MSSCKLHMSITNCTVKQSCIILVILVLFNNNTVCVLCIACFMLCVYWGLTKCVSGVSGGVSGGGGGGGCTEQ